MNIAALQSPDPVCRAGSVSPPDSEVMDLGYKKNHEAERSTLHGKKETPVKTGVFQTLEERLRRRLLLLI